MKKRVLLIVILIAVVTLAGTFFPPGECGAQTRSSRCWKCGEMFEACGVARRGNCPNCGARYVLPAATPPPRVVEPPPPPPEGTVRFEDAERYLGQTVTIQARVVGTFLSRRSGNLYLNYHRDFKSHVSILIPAANLPAFPADPAQFYDGKNVRATGEIIREGKYLRQRVTRPEDLEVL